MRPPIPPAQRRKNVSPVIQLRVPQALHDELRQACQVHGITLSELVRALIRRQPVRTVSSKRALGDTAQLVGELRRQGGLLKTRARSERTPELRQEMMTTLRTVQRLAARIWEQLERKQDVHQAR